jgi:hypothetical protein
MVVRLWEKQSNMSATFGNDRVAKDGGEKDLQPQWSSTVFKVEMPKRRIACRVVMPLK